MTFKTVMAGLWFLLCVYGATIVADYVDQQRGQIVGMCPPFASAGVPALMIYDTRTAAIFCSPLPQPDKSLLPPTARGDNPKQGV